LDLSERVLTHYDFWTGNTLWKGSKLVGVVDWSGARSAPRGVDLAWARLDLILQGRPEAARMFLDHYRSATGMDVADIWEWDLQAAAQAVDAVGTWSPNYVGVGLTDLTTDCLASRMAGWVEHLLSDQGI
jgi:aminoglycoside phosphotransferase (APT) family kinase protein